VKPTGEAHRTRASDQANGQPLNHAVAIFNLADHAVISADGAMKDEASIKGPMGAKSMARSDDLAGQIVISLRPSTAARDLQGDGRLAWFWVASRPTARLTNR